MDLLVNGNRLRFNRLFNRGQGKAVGRRIVHNMKDGQEFGDVKGCFPGKLSVEVPEIVKVIDPLRPDPIQHSSFSAVISSQCSRPVPEDPVQLCQVGNGGLSGFIRIHPFICPAIPF